MIDAFLLNNNNLKNKMSNQTSNRRIIRYKIYCLINQSLFQIVIHDLDYVCSGISGSLKAIGLRLWIIGVCITICNLRYKKKTINVSYMIVGTDKIKMYNL